MGLDWNPYAVPGLLAMAFALALAAVVFTRGPSRAPNRRLALLLFFEAVRVGAVWGLAYLATEPRDAYALFVVNVAANAVLLPLYLFFVATLDTPISRVLRKGWLMGAVFAAGLAKAALILVWPELFIADVVPTVRAQGWTLAFGPFWFEQLILDAAVLLVALAVAWSAYRRSAPASVDRRRARAYLAAFSVRDLLLLLRWGLVYPVVALSTTAPAWTAWYSVLVPPWETILFTAFLSYGILRAQLFEIDLRIKWTLKQSTVAGVFIAVFFIASETAQQLFSERWGPLVGIAGAGLLVLALHPLQRLGERVATTAMPAVKGPADMSDAERLQTYREMVRGAWEDGTLSIDERVMLDKLRQRLGLSAEVAAKVEREEMHA